jgi:hypothetical protein
MQALKGSGAPRAQQLRLPRLLMQRWTPGSAWRWQCRLPGAGELARVTTCTHHMMLLLALPPAGQVQVILVLLA